MIPAGYVAALPNVLKQTVFDTPLWKVLASFALLGVLVAILVAWARWTAPEPEEYSPNSYLRRLLLPAAMVLASYGAFYFIAYRINVTGRFSDLIYYVLSLAWHATAAWVAWLAIFVAIERIIGSPKIPD